VAYPAAQKQQKSLLIEGLSRERGKDSGNRAGIESVTGNTVREEAIRLAWNGGF
jgi:hypothetical protein